MGIDACASRARLPGLKLAQLGEKTAEPATADGLQSGSSCRIRLRRAWNGMERRGRKDRQTDGRTDGQRATAVCGRGHHGRRGSGQELGWASARSCVASYHASADVERASLSHHALSQSPSNRLEGRADKVLRTTVDPARPPPPRHTVLDSCERYVVDVSFNSTGPDRVVNTTPANERFNCNSLRPPRCSNHLASSSVNSPQVS